MNSAIQRPGWGLRGLAFAAYVGVAPWMWFRKKTDLHPFLDLHRRQALGIAVLGTGVALFFLFTVLVSSYSLVHLRSVYEILHLELWLLWLSRKLFLCWLVFWLYGAGLALVGSGTPLPVVWRIAKRNRWMNSMAATLLAMYALAATTTALVFYAEGYVRSDEKPGKVYMVYEDAKVFPRWIFVLGFFPIARAAHDAFGQDSAVLLPLSRPNIARALNEGRFVFLGTHGGKEGILMDARYYVPPTDIGALGGNPGLKFVYLTCCDSGAQKDAWERAFAPARVITYNRLTAVAEHAWWLWFEGPGIVRQLGQTQPSVPSPKPN